MKKTAFILSITIAWIMSSCTSTFYYSTLNTITPNVEKVDNGDFLYETDSLWIAYCFKGEDAPIQITVFNKLDVPLFINWQHSALIIDGVSYPYSDAKITYVERSEGTIYKDPLISGVSHNYIDTRGSVDIPKHISFIPPHSMVSHKTLRIAARFDEIKDSKYIVGRLATADNESEYIKRINYDIQSTPLQFGSYLTVYTKVEHPQGYRTDFYMTNLIKTKITPNLLPSEMAERGDTFYQQKQPNNTGWEILGVTAIAAGAVAVDVWANKDNCRNCY